MGEIWQFYHVIWQFSLIKQPSVIAFQVSEQQNRRAKGCGSSSKTWVCCLACPFAYKKFSNFNFRLDKTGHHQQNPARKGKTWPITCYCRLQSNEIMAYESLPNPDNNYEQCGWADEISHSFFKLRRPKISFYSFFHVLYDSVINFIQARYQNLTFFVITEKYREGELSSCYQWP